MLTHVAEGTYTHTQTGDTDMNNINLDLFLNDIGFSTMDMNQQGYGTYPEVNIPQHYAGILEQCMYKEIHQGNGLVGIIQHKSFSPVGHGTCATVLVKGAKWHTTSCSAFYAVKEGMGWKSILWYDELFSVGELIKAYLHFMHQPIVRSMTAPEWAFKMGTLKPPGTEPPCWKDVLTTRHIRWWGTICPTDLDEAYSLGTHCKWGTTLDAVCDMRQHSLHDVMPPVRQEPLKNSCV